MFLFINKSNFKGIILAEAGVKVEVRAEITKNP